MPQPPPPFSGLPLPALGVLASGAVARINLPAEGVSHGGHMGWTMACGTARIASDVSAGRRPERLIDGLAPRPGVGG